VATPILTVERRTNSPRAREITFQVGVTSKEAPIRVLSLIPNIPPDTTLVSSRGANLIELEAKKQSLCESLASLAQDLRLTTEPELKSRVANVWKDVLKTSTKQLNFLDRIYALFIGNQVIRVAEEAESRYQALFTQITSSKRARRILESLRRSKSVDQSQVEVFGHNVEELSALEQQLEDLLPGEGIALVSATTPLSETFTLRFERDLFESRTIDHGFNVEVAPNALTSSLIGILGACLGVCLRNPTSLAGLIDARRGRDAMQQLTSVWLVPIILGAAVPHIYEYLKFFKALPTRLDWRVTMLIGILCGLASERIVQALTVLVTGHA
jgi:hypothetical protein